MMPMRKHPISGRNPRQIILPLLIARALYEDPLDPDS
jgi:hypothetical protein